MRAIALLLLTACADDPVPDDGVVCGDGRRDELEPCDDGNRVNGDGCSVVCDPETLATVYFRFYPSVGAEPLDGMCRPGVASIEVVTEVNTSKTFPCDGRREGTIFVQTEKRVFARLRDANGEMIAESLPREPSVNGAVNAEFYEDGGWVRAWFARGCEMSTVELTLVPVDGGAPIYMANSCALGQIQSITSGVAKAGVYDVTLEKAHVQRTITGVIVKPNNGVTDLDFQ